MLSRRSMLTLSAAAVLASREAAAESQVARMSQLWGGLELLDPEGRSFRLADIPQQLKLVKLWAHWCPGCLVEMPSLAALAKALGEQRAQVILVSHPDDWRRDQLVAQRLKIPFRLATVSPANRSGAVRAALLDSDGAYVVPRSLVFSGPENVLAAQHTGSSDWTEQVPLLKARLG